MMMRQISKRICSNAHQVNKSDLILSNCLFNSIHRFSSSSTTSFSTKKPSPATAALLKTNKDRITDYVNRDLYLRRPANAARHIYIFLNKHEQLIQKKLATVQDLPDWCTPALVFRVASDFIDTPELMHKFISEMSNFEPSLITPAVVNKLIQSYTKAGQPDIALGLALGKTLPGDQYYPINTTIQCDSIMLSTIMNGFTTDKQYEKALHLFGLYVKTLKDPKSQIRQTLDSAQLASILSRLISNYNQMEQFNCSIMVFTFMMRENITNPNPNDANLTQLHSLLSAFPATVLEHLYPSASAFNSLITGLAGAGKADRAFEFALASHKIQRRVLELAGIDIKTEDPVVYKRSIDETKKDEFNLIHHDDLDLRFRAVISAYFKQGKVKKALNAYNVFTSANFQSNHNALSFCTARPSSTTVGVLAEALILNNQYETARDLIQEAETKFHTFFNSIVCNRVLAGLWGNGQIEEANKFFQFMTDSENFHQRPDVESIEIMINGYIRIGNIDEAVKLLSFRKNRVFPSAQSYITCAKEMLKIYDVENALSLMDSMIHVANRRHLLDLTEAFIRVLTTQGKYTPEELKEIIQGKLREKKKDHKYIQAKLFSLFRQELIKSVDSVEKYKQSQQYGSDTIAQMVFEELNTALNAYTLESKRAMAEINMQRVTRETALAMTLSYTPKLFNKVIGLRRKLTAENNEQKDREIRKETRMEMKKLADLKRKEAMKKVANKNGDQKMQV